MNTCPLPVLVGAAAITEAPIILKIQCAVAIAYIKMQITIMATFRLWCGLSHLEDQSVSVVYRTMYITNMILTPIEGLNM